MTARTVYAASLAAAESTKLATDAAAELTRQVTVDASNTIVAYNNATGNYGNLASAIKSANAAKLASLYAAEVAKQQTLMQARDTLRSSGSDLAAF
jgi:hypothetical protein